MIGLSVILRTGVVATMVAWGASGSPIAGQRPVASFKSSIDLVRISAVVRDRKGRFVQDLAARDFEVLDDGQARPITDFRTDHESGPA